MAKHYKSLAASSVDANRKAFKRVLLQFKTAEGDLSDLRKALGIVDRKGRQRPGINSALLRRARGKIASKRVLTSARSVSVKTYQRGTEIDAALALSLGKGA